MEPRRAGQRLGRWRVGTSGDQYDHWRGKLYPPGLAKRAWLAHYARCFDSVEIDSTFYALPQEQTSARWAAEVGPDFRFALKLSRYITHLKRLRDPVEPLRRFLELARELGPKLGPVLVQLPPRWRADPRRLRGFLPALEPQLRWAVEFRDPSWWRPDVFALLEAAGVALCLHNALEDHPVLLTTSWTYLRFRLEGSARSAARNPLKSSWPRVEFPLAGEADPAPHRPAT